MKSERGSATVLGIFMIMLLGSLGATLLMLCITHLEIATNHRDGIVAQYWAEAGMAEAVAKLKTNKEFVNETQIGNQITTANFPSQLRTTGSYTVQTGPDPHVATKNVRVIIATGIVNKANRQIIAHVTIPNPGDNFKNFLIIRNFKEGEYFGT